MKTVYVVHFVTKYNLSLWLRASFYIITRGGAAL